jgi:hypothetical protein
VRKQPLAAGSAVRTRIVAPLSILILTVCGMASAAEDQDRRYGAQVPGTVVELQPFRQTSSVPVRSLGGREGVATLVNLNPMINSWYLLRIAWKDGAPETVVHLENPKPHRAHLLLDEKYPSGIVVSEGGTRTPCELFSGVLDQARTSPRVYYPFCEGRFYLRNPSKGHRSSLESAVEFLRDRVWGGEQVISVFHHLLADRYRESGELAPTPAIMQPKGAGMEAAQPLAADVDLQYAGRRLIPRDMGIALEKEGPEKDGMVPGAWYAAANPGTWVSIMQPNFIAAPILQSYKSVVNSLDQVEASSLSYLIAFDLDQFELGYELGTDHPRVSWSDRVTGPMRDSALSGPDGIDTIAPLITVGLIRPDNVPKTEAAFIGGFKRNHGAFRTGDLALRNHGSHYGFIENGVVLSKLQPGLATVFVTDDSVGMKTWTEADNALLSKIRHARQNGVAIIEAGGSESKTSAGLPVPGSLVGRWGQGNWSGSENEKQRTMRSGLALQKSHGKTFLIYAVFSDATPSAMARVFQSYQVNYAMLLDMNALEHTYLAVYRRSGGELSVDHLLTGMSVLDKLPSGELVPRFLGYSDNRDFFYLMRRGAKGAKP